MRCDYRDRSFWCSSHRTGGSVFCWKHDPSKAAERADVTRRQQTTRANTEARKKRIAGTAAARVMQRVYAARARGCGLILERSEVEALIEYVHNHRVSGDDDG